MSSSEEKISPPTKRRRSSILRRKSVVPVVPIEYSQELALREYLADLKREKEEWGNFYRERRAQLKVSEDALAQVSAEPPTFTSEVFLSHLTEEDLKNIQHPDYEKLCNDTDRLIELAAIAKLRLDEASSALKINFTCFKARLNELSKSICTFNDSAPLWQQDPSKAPERRV